MEAASSSEILVTIYRTKRRYVPENIAFHMFYHLNARSCTVLQVLKNVKPEVGK
jgi:hypothetical protein